MLKSIFAIMIILLAATANNAQVPQLINYQGMLTDANGNPITGSRSIQFKIYGSAQGGNALWSETQTATVTDGIFSVLLGSTTPIPFSVFDGSDKYLSLQVESDPEMAPRKRLVSVGYAFRAYDADKLDGINASSFIQSGQANSVSTDMIQDDAVTADKVLPNIVSSLNGVTNDGGNIDLVEGSNVTITPDDANNRITISASGGGGGGDNLGNHRATENIQLRGNWLSGDGGNEGVYVDNNGNVGIATANPGAQLEVAGTVQMTGFKMPIGASNGFLLTSDASGNGRWLALPPLPPYYIVGNGTANYLTKYLDPSTIGNSILYETGSKIGIGTTTPGEKLEVAGTVQMTGFKLSTGASDGFLLTSDASGNGMWLPLPPGHLMGSGTTNYLPKFTSDTWLGNSILYETNGKIGIGTTNPGAKLDVNGDVHITGMISKGGGSFLIDHPLDPENKFLQHSFVESPDMKNVYDGVVVLDANGEATVELPEWFEALNRDFRYQLTAIGAPGPNLYIAREISSNNFSIAGGMPATKVSWQVTGIRQDAFANAHRIQVEVEKKGEKRGKYLYPKEHGLQEPMGIDYDDRQMLQEDMREIEKERMKMEVIRKRPGIK